MGVRNAKEEEQAALWRGRREMAHVCCDAPWRFILTCLRRLNCPPLPCETQTIEYKYDTRKSTTHPHLHPAPQPDIAVRHLLMQLQVANCKQALPATLARHVGAAASVNRVQKCDGDNKAHKLTHSRAIAGLKLPFRQRHLVGAHCDELVWAKLGQDSRGRKQGALTEQWSDWSARSGVNRRKRKFLT